MIVGYARVSTDGQTLDAQHAALAAAGAERVFAEKVSGAVTERKALAKAIAACGPGDTLIVTKLDRLARSTRDLLNTLDAIGKAGAGFKSRADTWWGVVRGSSVLRNGYVDIFYRTVGDHLLPPPAEGVDTR
jgi:DNA invertase Pin-like site-specific DNA recombinase